MTEQQFYLMVKEMREAQRVYDNIPDPYIEKPLNRPLVAKRNQAYHTKVELENKVGQAIKEYFETNNKQTK